MIEREKELLNHHHHEHQQQHQHQQQHTIDMIKNSNNNNNSDDVAVGGGGGGGIINNNKKMNLFNPNSLNLNLSNHALDATSSATSTSSAASSSCNSMTSLNMLNDDRIKNAAAIVTNGSSSSNSNKILCVDVKDDVCAIDEENLSVMNKEHHTLIPASSSSSSFKNNMLKKPQLNIPFGSGPVKPRPKFEFPFNSSSNTNGNNTTTTTTMGAFNPNLLDKSNKMLKDLRIGSDYNGQQQQQQQSFVSFADKSGKLTIMPNEVYDFNESELNEIKEIGHGEFGSVYKVLHKPTNTLMALKKIRSNVDEREQRKLIKELDIVMQCNDFTYVVKFYGVKFNNKEGDCLICMELMDTSLDFFYKYIYEVMNETIPERILGQILLSTLNALNYLKEKHRIIHRDVKPSNILLNKEGSIKLCDFGISGRLVNSIAQTMDVGCRPYMAPERIDPNRPQSGYDVRSDVWSLGITLYELATGKFPYPQWNSVFDQLHSVVNGEAPRLEDDRLSKKFRNFVNTCLTKDDSKRPKYKDLLRHPYVLEQMQKQVQINDYVTSIIDRMNSTSQTTTTAK